MNLFELEQELFEITNELEENGGELTPELEARLNITNDNCEELLHKCHDMVQYQKSNDALIKDKIEHLKSRSTAISNTITKFKDIACKAVQLYGVPSKTGGMGCKYADLTVFLRNTTAVEINDEDVQDLIIALDPDMILPLPNGKELEIDSIENIIATVDIKISINPYQAKLVMAHLKEILNGVDDDNINVTHEVKFDKTVIKRLDSYGQLDVKGINVVTNTNINFR